MPEQQRFYEEAPRTPIETCGAQAFDDACSACSQHSYERNGKSFRSVVIGSELIPGKGPGTLLVVGPKPDRHDAAQKRPLAGPLGLRVRGILQKVWGGHVVLDNATKCAAAAMPDIEHIAACRPFLAETVAAHKPDRIIAMGEAAIYAFTGREKGPAQNALNFRRAYTWVDVGGKLVPVFFVLSPSSGRDNVFIQRYFERDLKWAATAQLPKPKHRDGVFWCVTTKEEAQAAVADAKRAEAFALDAEWAGFLFDPDFRLLCCSIQGLGVGDTWSWDENALNDEEVFAPLREVLEDADAPKGGANIKADVHAFWSWKQVRVRGITFDIRLWRKLLDPEASGYLEDMQEFVGMGGGKEEMEEAIAQVEKRIEKLAARKASANQNAFEFDASVDAAVRLGFDVKRYAPNPRAIAYAFVPKAMLTRYNARDTYSTARIASRFQGELLRSPERMMIWDKVILPAAVAIQRVEEWGVPFDVGAGTLFGQMMQGSLDEALKRIHLTAPKLNPGSPQQLAKLLYEDLGLEAGRETDSGAKSTDEEALDALRDQHPIVGDILTYRHYEKLVGYANDWLGLIRGDGRIHPSIHLDGARSGRTSCSDPNLQNVPRASTEDGKRARDCFVAPPGYVFVELDYAQLEYRIAAYISRDPEMARIIRSGEDFHLGTAKLVAELAWGITPDKVTDIHRTGAKAINFGLLYGKTDRTLAAELGISEEKAAALRKSILGKFTRLQQWIKEATAYAREHGGCWTYWEGERARWRPLWRIADQSDEGRRRASTAKNGAVNSPIQGTASEFCVASLTKLVNAAVAKKIDAQVILPIHDSIMLLTPEKEAYHTAEAAKAAMLDYPWCTDVVPLGVDIKVGTKWGSLTKFKL